LDHPFDEPVNLAEGALFGSSLTVDSILMFSNRSVHTRTVRSDEEAPDDGRVFSESIPTGEDLLALSEALEAFVGQLAERSGGTTMMTKLAKAISSSTAPAKAGRLPELPVSVSATPLLKGNGHPGVRRDYRVHGILKASHFRHFVSPVAIGRDDQASSRHRGWDWGEPQGMSPDAPSWNPRGDATEGRGTLLQQAAGPDYCETEFDGVLFTGECATQAEVDDLLALVAVLDYEVEQWIDEMVTALGGPGGGCDPFTDPGCELELLQSFVGELIVACENGEDGVFLSGGSCAMEMIGAVTGVAGWFASKALTVHFLAGIGVGAKVAAGAVAWAVVGNVAVAVGASAAAAALIACLV
jgi:hypothetical protein